MRKLDINKVKNLAKRRRQMQLFFTVVIIFIVLSAIFIVSKVKDFNIDKTNSNILYVGSLTIILVFTILLFFMLSELMRPTYVLKNDLKTIYLRRSATKVIEIQIVDLKRVKSRVKSRKKNKKPFGTLIIRTKNKRYKLKNIFDVEEVEENIKILYERLAAFNEGYQQAERDRQEDNIGDLSNLL